MSTKPFSPTQFTATQWSTQADKAKFANHLVRFMETGCTRTMFPHWFYTRLSCCFGHIAHYNLDGFYGEWFFGPQSRAAFLRNLDRWGCYGDPAWTFSDVEKALQAYYKEPR